MIANEPLNGIQCVSVCAFSLSLALVNDIIIIDPEALQ